MSTGDNANIVFIGDYMSYKFIFVCTAMALTSMAFGVPELIAAGCLLIALQGRYMMQ